MLTCFSYVSLATVQIRCLLCMQENFSGRSLSDLADNTICMPWYKYTTVSLVTKINRSQDAVAVSNGFL